MPSQFRPFNADQTREQFRSTPFSIRGRGAACRLGGMCASGSKSEELTTSKCPLYSISRLRLATIDSSESYQCATWSRSLDDLIGAGEQRRGDVEAESFGGSEIDDELKFGRRLHGQVGGLLPLRIRST